MVRTVTNNSFSLAPNSGRSDSTVLDSQRPTILAAPRYNATLMSKKTGQPLFKKVKMKHSTRKVKAKMKDRKRGN